MGAVTISTGKLFHTFAIRNFEFQKSFVLAAKGCNLASFLLFHTVATGHQHTAYVLSMGLVNEETVTVIDKLSVAVPWSTNNVT